MNIQICSDLHLEFNENRKWIKENPLTPSGDILIIAGDTYYLEDQIRQLDFIKQVSDEFQATYLIPGNHEYYNGYNVATAMEPTFEKLRDNVILVNNKSHRHQWLPIHLHHPMVSHTEKYIGGHAGNDRFSEH